MLSNTRKLYILLSFVIICINNNNVNSMINNDETYDNNNQSYYDVEDEWEYLIEDKNNKLKQYLDYVINELQNDNNEINEQIYYFTINKFQNIIDKAHNETGEYDITDRDAKSLDTLYKNFKKKNNKSCSSDEKKQCKIEINNEIEKIVLRDMQSTLISINEQITYCKKNLISSLETMEDDILIFSDILSNANYTEIEKRKIVIENLYKYIDNDKIYEQYNPISYCMYENNKFKTYLSIFNDLNNVRDQFYSLQDNIKAISYLNGEITNCTCNSSNNIDFPIIYNNLNIAFQDVNTITTNISKKMQNISSVYLEKIQSEKYNVHQDRQYYYFSYVIQQDKNIYENFLKCLFDYYNKKYITLQKYKKILEYFLYCNMYTILEEQCFNVNNNEVSLEMRQTNGNTKLISLNKMNKWKIESGNYNHITKDIVKSSTKIANAKNTINELANIFIKQNNLQISDKESIDKVLEDINNMLYTIINKAAKTFLKNIYIYDKNCILGHKYDIENFINQNISKLNPIIKEIYNKYLVVCNENTNDDTNTNTFYAIKNNLNNNISETNSKNSNIINEKINDNNSNNKLMGSNFNQINNNNGINNINSMDDINSLNNTNNEVFDKKEEAKPNSFLETID